MSEYVTVVSVDLQPKLTVNAIKNAHNNDVAAAATASSAEKAPPVIEKKSAFVTVLSINNNQNTTTICTTTAAVASVAVAAENHTREGEIVTVYRLPGERLGFGLKFQGGTKTDERVQRLFIQSCDADSPASKARASWGSLGEGNEILKIDNEPVTTMTRIECVKCLKDRNVAINLLVRQKNKNINGNQTNSGYSNGLESAKKRPKPPPPPMVPPRKIYRKPVPVPTTMTTSLKSLPPPVISIEPPPTPVVAEMYLNTLDDHEVDVNRNDESDETGSTISSQISVISNFSSESDLSLLSANASNSELTKILTKPFQMIEREFNVNGSHILPCPATTSYTSPMSIDNLLLFNDSEHSSSSIEIADDEKIKIDANSSLMSVAAVTTPGTTITTSSMSMSTKVYENADVISEDQRQYENISIKLPPVPRPRSISSTINSSVTVKPSMSQDVKTDLNAKSPSNTIESWLNGANAENGNHQGDKNGSLKDDRGQSYESAIKFECFAARNDDEDDDKLGPSELLDMSEAYFNFSWCGNSNGNLPTIGEAEEEFSSIEQPITGQQGASNKFDKRPIFIVNTVHDIENEVIECNTMSENCSPNCDGEINNNNNTFYLQLECEDKRDKTDKKTQQKTVKFSRCEEVVSMRNSDNQKKLMKMKNLKSCKQIDEPTGVQVSTSSPAADKSDIVKSKKIDELNGNLMSKSNNEIPAKSKYRYASDSEILKTEPKVNGVNKTNSITSSSPVSNSVSTPRPPPPPPPTTKTTTETSQSIETADKCTEMSSSYPASVHRQSASVTQMEQQEQLFNDRIVRENSRLPPDGREYPTQINSKFEKQHTTTTSSTTTKSSDNSSSSIAIDLTKSQATSKATAIVAPLVPRKMQHFEEITNFVDSKPPFKSATLGRQRPINWRNKDEKSEKSVKDKIAMFSNSTSDISHILPKSPMVISASTTTLNSFRTIHVSDKTNLSHRFNSFTKSTENIFGSNDVSNGFKSKVNGSMRKKAMSVENLDDYDVVDDATANDFDDFAWRREDIQLNYQPVSKPASLHSPALTARPLTLNIGKAMSVENLIDSPALPSRPPPASAPTLARRISFSGLTNNQIEENRKSITNLLESRKKSMSKLRGLVIPEKVSEADQKVLDLPVIRSKECELISGNTIFNRSVSLQSSPVFSPKPPTIKSLSERKSEFELASSKKTTTNHNSEAEKRFEIAALKSPPIKPPRTSLIISRTSATDDSDNESCISSSRVSSPPISPVAKKPLTRTLSSETNTSMSSNSTLTSGSGSQASCSSNASTPDGHIINNNGKQSSNGNEIGTSRKSILASSKSRSGRECLDKSWRDEDSTDGGGIDNDDRRRMSKAKTRSSMINYKLVSAGDQIADKVINVATYVEVMSSDSDEKPEAHSTLPVAKNDTSSTTTKLTTSTTIAASMTTTATASVKKEAPQTNHMLSDMAKWVRSEATKVSEPIVVKQEASTEIRTTAKVLEPPRKLSLAEIRKNFENKTVCSINNNEKQQTQNIHNSNLTNGVTPSKTIKERPISNHNRFSSWDSVGSSSSGVSSEMLGTGTGTHNSESLQTDFGSFSSFGSSHSLITPQDLQLIIDEADPPLETPEAFVVVLNRETHESSIGITLAGGSDYEAKEITIHKILANSPADKDGRLRRGDRILSINGLTMRGLTHRESLGVLKSPRSDVVMVVTRSKSVVKTNSLTKSSIRGSLGSLSSLNEKSDSLEVDGISIRKTLNSAKSLEMSLDSISTEDCSISSKSLDNGHSEKPSLDYKVNEVETITIIKDGAGLGFSIDGGYDSPTGNRPLVVKKIFMGGAAERTGNLKVGDEILEINGNSIDRQTRIDVWNMIKKLPYGDAVHLTLKRK